MEESRIDRSIGFQPMDTRGIGFQPMNQGQDAQAQSHRQDADATAHRQDVRGTGFQPVDGGQEACAPPHRQDADATPIVHGEIRKRHGANLPHWTAAGATFSVTFRLANSLPQHVLDGLARERREIVMRAEAAGRALTPEEAQRLRWLFSEKIERFLDAGYGECVLRDGRAAAIVRDALGHFDGQRYDVHAWCIMPNHVHVVFRPRPPHDLSGIMHSWKSFTANRINRVLGRSGTLWQSESHDHIIRDAEDFSHAIHYVLGNPASAGLRNWPWCGTAFQAVG